MYQQVVERQMNPRIEDVENWVDGLVKTHFPKTEDYVLDVFAYGSKDGGYRSPFALARLMPDQEMREAFLEYVERQILKVGNYTLTNTNHDRGKVQIQRKQIERRYGLHRNMVLHKHPFST